MTGYDMDRYVWKLGWSDASANVLVGHNADINKFCNSDNGVLGKKQYPGQLIRVWVRYEFGAHINVEEAQHRLSETGVPHGIEQGAVQMEVLQHFQPTLSGPATIASPFLRGPETGR